MSCGAELKIRETLCAKLGVKARFLGARALLLSAFFSIAFNVPQDSVQAQKKKTYTQADIKVVYITQFGQAIAWPKAAFENAKNPLVITVFGPEHQRDSWDKVAKRTINKRKIKIVRTNDLKKIKESHILFVSSGVPKRNWPNIFAAAQGLPILIVGESDNFAVKGGSINFFVKEGNRIGYEINPRQIKSQSLMPDAMILKLGVVVGMQQSGTQKGVSQP